MPDLSNRRTIAALQARDVRWRCDPAELGFASTAELAPLERTIGQERGVDAIAFGLAVEHDGFNVFVAGPAGSGRRTTAQDLIRRAATSRSPAPDWCYLHNFDDPAQPAAVQLPTGRGPELARDMDTFITASRREFPRVFEGEQYQQRRAELAQQVQAQREQVLDQLRAEAQQLGFDVQLSPTGVATVPLLEPGKPLTAEAFDLLPDARKAEIRAKGQ